MLIQDGQKRVKMLMNSLNFNPGDIVVATILFSEQVGAKKRLALVISNIEYNKKSDDIILLKITSKGKKNKYYAELTQKDLEEGKIKLESQIMVDNPVTTYKQLIESKVGRITKQKLKEVKQKTKELYEL